MSCNLIYMLIVSDVYSPYSPTQLLTQLRILYTTIHHISISTLHFNAHQPTNYICVNTVVFTTVVMLYHGIGGTEGSAG